MKNINLLILAAGKGTRLGKKTKKKPKILLKYKKKFLFDYHLEVYKKFKNISLKIDCRKEVGNKNRCIRIARWIRFTSQSS